MEKCGIEKTVNKTSAHLIAMEEKTVTLRVELRAESQWRKHIQSVSPTSYQVTSETCLVTYSNTPARGLRVCSSTSSRISPQMQFRFNSSAISDAPSSSALHSPTHSPTCMASSRQMWRHIMEKDWHAELFAFLQSCRHFQRDCHSIADARLHCGGG